METEELTYVRMRAREVHDFWHPLFGLPTNLIGSSNVEFGLVFKMLDTSSILDSESDFRDKKLIATRHT
ncbi:putative ubiquinone biosynthesis protein Coq4 [Helianthus annuus]|nr:putative ubiquinone biosynthesis protein Coq4 [Helianthus annuus]KAJ0622477.1 putative ubiquinone biosynthesis protein Coq4 [Helianthus annuus]KAJ0626728.1 putative ubiquinone biosynthesis protein Coq4 [Helianthus annuus]KAJ0783077.1 putative ubiquinone biosynthesis protein Coq4 [Helianthus annuus]KAJ0947779.1 putative ubiquinone biosynthesis protein Coq4 [Helianthus annuus]